MALAALLAASAWGAAAWGQADCRALGDQRDQLARQAMQAEIALLHALRQRLCPQQEALASAANALSADAPQASPFDYAGYIRCRARAEAQLERSRPVLFRNRLGFTFYTAPGARLAREADARHSQRERDCPAPAP